MTVDSSAMKTPWTAKPDACDFPSPTADMRTLG